MGHATIAITAALAAAYFIAIFLTGRAIARCSPVLAEPPAAAPTADDIVRWNTPDVMYDRGMYVGLQREPGPGPWDGPPPDVPTSASGASPCR